MDLDRRRRSAVFLIVLGLVLLAFNLGLVRRPSVDEWWPVILVAIGAWMFIDALGGGRERSAVFPATIIGGVGLVFLINEWDLVPGGIGELWPAFLIVVGMAFVMLYLFDEREAGVLIPAAILLAIGIVVLLANLGLIGTDPWRLVGTYWPIILIAIGLGGLFSSVGRPPAGGGGSGGTGAFGK